MNLKFLPSIFVLLILFTTGRGYGDAVFSHREWEQVLSEYVDEQGLVDYVGLSRNRTTFESYILKIEEIGPRSYPELFPTKNDKLAFYINAYNALTFRGVLSRGPEEVSVWTGPISGYFFFEVMDIHVEGYQTTLKSLEDDIIRAGFNDPRIHAAINCASISCPRLSRKAFGGSMLDQQLDDSMKEFASKKSNVDILEDTLYLSSIFDWFEEDFVSYEVRNGNLRGSDKTKIVSYINRYRSPDDQLNTEQRVRYFDYDKRINKQ